MTSVSDTQTSQLSQSEPTTLHNSPIDYGLGSLGLEAAFKFFVGYYMFFYVDMLGLAIALAAIINVIYALWDAVNDPLVGYLSDNTRTRWGRRKPWMLTALPFYVIFLVLIYAVPDVLKSKTERVTSVLLTQSIVIRQIYLDMHLHLKGTAICLRVFLHLQVQYNRL